MYIVCDRYVVIICMLPVQGYSHVTRVCAWHVETRDVERGLWYLAKMTVGVMREAILVETVASRPRHLFEVFFYVRWDQHEHVRALSVARHGYGDRCS